MISTVRKKSARQFARGSRGILTSLLLVLGLVLWWLYRTEVSGLQAITRALEQHGIQLASQSMSAKQEILGGDTLYLAEHASLHRWLDTGNPRRRCARAAIFALSPVAVGSTIRSGSSTSGAGNGCASTGTMGGPEWCLPDEHQDKSGRFYVEKTLRPWFDIPDRAGLCATTLSRFPFVERIASPPAGFRFDRKSGRIPNLCVHSSRVGSIEPGTLVDEKAKAVRPLSKPLSMFQGEQR